MKDVTHYPLVILGSGPAGLTAAIYATRLGIRALVLEGTQPGGQLVETDTVENWPGEEKILGPLLMRNMRTQAEKFGAHGLAATATAVALHTSPFTISTSQRSYTADALIIATGAHPRRLNCPGEHTYWGKGVSTCAVCDGALYRNESVVVIGGGDSAAEKATFMTKFTDRVVLVHEHDRLTASGNLQKRVRDNPRITIVPHSTISEVTGDGARMSGVVITDLISTRTHTHAARALFLAIGSQPNSELIAGQLTRTPAGHIVVQHPTTKTSVAGVFACGDVSDPVYRQAITAAGAGCAAALDAINFLHQKQ